MRSFSLPVFTTTYYIYIYIIYFFVLYKDILSYPASESVDSSFYIWRCCWWKLVGLWRPTLSDTRPSSKEKKTLFFFFKYLFFLYLLASFGCWLFHVWWVCVSPGYIIVVSSLHYGFTLSVSFLTLSNVATRLVSPFSLSPSLLYVCVDCMYSLVLVVSQCLSLLCIYLSI